MKVAVEEALSELEAAHPATKVQRKEDGDGGAYVLVEEVALGERYAPSTSWVAFHITWTYEEGADVYPFFINDAVRYVGDGETPIAGPEGDPAKALPAAMSHGFVAPGWEDLSAIQVSRRSHAPAQDTAVQKLGRVLEWIRTR
jgi:hypothetical protein